MSLDPQYLLDQYEHFSRAYKSDDLKLSLEDQSFTALVNLRSTLDELASTLETSDVERLRSADQRFAVVFEAETLRVYADYYAGLPLRTWWSLTPAPR